MPRRKPSTGQLSLLGDELPEDPAGLFSRETPPARQQARKQGYCGRSHAILPCHRSNLARVMNSEAAAAI